MVFPDDDDVYSEYREAKMKGESLFVFKREKAESEGQRGKHKGTLESEIRNAIS